MSRPSVDPAPAAPAAPRRAAAVRTPAQSQLPGWAQWLLIGLTVLGLLLPLLDRYADIDPTPKPDEHRTLAPAPEQPTTLQGVFAYPAAYERWYNDHFGFRASLIHAHALLKLEVFGVSPNPDVLIGRDGWLFLGKNKAVDAYRCLFPFDEKALAWEADNVRAHRDWLAERGIAYLHVWAPLKHAVYPEFLPPWLERGSGPCRLDQWLQRMQREGLPVLDLRPSQQQARAAGRSYQRTDTHWNARGAYFGYRALAEALKVRFPELDVLPPERVHFREAEVPGGDLARMMDMAEHYRGPTVFADIDAPRCKKGSLEGIERHEGIKLEAFECERGPRIVMLHDSFGNGLIPYLGETAGRLLAAEFSSFDKALIERERPDIVIEVHLERQLQPDREQAAR